MSAQIHKEKLRNLVNQLLPELNTENSKLICNAGVDTDALIIENKFIALYSKKAWQYSPQKTVTICELIREYVRIEIPEAIARAQDIVICKMIPGIAMEPESFVNDEILVGNAAKKLEEFLFDLTKIPVQKFSHLQLLQVSPPTVQEIESTIDEARKYLFPHLYTRAKRWIENHFSSFLKNSDMLKYDLCLLHGELVPPHILYDPDSRSINGIIDFGHASLGDPANNLVWLIRFYGQSFAEKICCDNSVLESHLYRARFYIGYQLVKNLIEGVKNNDLSALLSLTSWKMGFDPLF